MQVALEIHSIFDRTKNITESNEIHMAVYSDHMCLFTG
jgi:hypothetical protein